MEPLAIGLLSIILGGLAWCSYRDSRLYAAFQKLEQSEPRIRFYRRWTVESLILFGIGGVALLLAIGRIEALWVFPSDFAGASAPIRAVADPAGSSVERMLGMAIGLAIGLSVTALVWKMRLRKIRQPVVGDIEALLPRNRKEVLACIPLAINAGISEEIFFRVALPLLALMATGSVTAAIAISIAAFGLAHWYQGWKGVFATTAVGGLLFWFYLSSGSLLKPIAFHIMIDMVALVIRPYISLYLVNRKANQPTTYDGQSTAKATLERETTA
jgi:uncharacterized protein